MISLKIKKSSMRIYLLCLLLFLGLFRICLFTNTTFRAYSFLILFIFFLRVGSNFRRLRRHRYALLLGAIVALSVLYQSHSETSIFNSATYFLQFISPYLVLDYLIQKKGRYSTIKGITLVSFSVCTMMDLSVLLGMDIDKSHYQNLITYLFGNKFMVAYLHMQTLGFIATFKKMSRNNVNHFIGLDVLFYGVFGIIMCARVNCATGIIGNTVVLILLCAPLSKKVKMVLAKPTTMLLMLLVVNILIVGSDVLIQMPVVRNLIINVLHKDLTLTGRNKIYAMLPAIYTDHWILGYGYNSDIFAGLIGYGNAQNGILQYILDCGLVGAGAFILNWFKSVKTDVAEASKIWPAICVVYGFIFCASVEVCFKFNFILTLAVISTMSLTGDNFE